MWAGGFGCEHAGGHWQHQNCTQLLDKPCGHPAKNLSLLPCALACTGAAAPAR